MTVTREEKIYRSGMEKRIGSLEEIWTKEAVEQAMPMSDPPAVDLSDLEDRAEGVEKRMEIIEKRTIDAEDLKQGARVVRDSNKELKDWLFRHQLDSETVQSLERIWKGIERSVRLLKDDYREHELELYGQGNGNGLTRRLERVEERVEIIVGEMWWIRKGVLIVLILTLLSLGQFWWRFGWGV